MTADRAMREPALRREPHPRAEDHRLRRPGQRRAQRARHFYALRGPAKGARRRAWHRVARDRFALPSRQAHGPLVRELPEGRLRQAREGRRHPARRDCVCQGQGGLQRSLRVAGSSRNLLRAAASVSRGPIPEPLHYFLPAPNASLSRRLVHQRGLRYCIK